MNRRTTLNSYRERIQRVVDYLWENPERECTAMELADIAHFSHWHFHRIYHELAGETVYQTVRRVRLHRAATRLLRTDDSMERIAASAHYGSVEAFTRAFGVAYGVTPARFRAERRRASRPNQPLPQKKEYPMNYKVEVIDLPRLTLGTITHQGDYNGIGQVFDKLFVVAQTHQLITPDTRAFGIFYDDPCTVEESNLRSEAGITVTEAQARDAGLSVREIGGGPHAVLTHVGSYAELEKPYQWLYGEWLPTSGHEAADSAPFEEYPNDPRETPASELITRIYLPLQG